ncbi:MAG: phenylalanine 4-monooxygenase [Hydrogenophaga sp.]|jgi:phenylalanine-4-hydroxylase|uniref:phenylalanine 4-monooxygenase n=1 Tax=Hydrogenophaga sp. TaxID=1904254 RepID=UPI0025C01D06|nr:phenylalanine 4-monooxygenase [Hydrogenophaga sp.]MDO9132589.1 phenylalanine 4-monooxygenase [Hydrogenophaga sp.]MDP3203648.1 phenylalanine 4-monooxygenase [Hydrogenophaga sp.]MDP3624967.1 phenylalanine 4-monooxygenase [Hydrogenophaga sp.]MDZ4101428.1 phenylalanine 4-monooxygenase [Hydrogenophaga sp.]
MAVEPVVYGASDRPPRGDYTRAEADYTCPQNWAAYTDADHDTYRRLYERQTALLPGLACDAFIEALPSLGARDRIPRFEDINERLKPATGWELVAVPGLIPERPFFDLLANRRFPVTDWIRTPDEFDYVVEPDVFHDLFGHVPLLFKPVFADYVQRYGAGGLKAHDLGAGELLSRLYWYTIEFGLISQADGLRAYGAGILSSSGELRHSVSSPQPQRIALDLMRCMRTRYKIDDYQATYFVIDSFDQLFDMTAPDFAPLYEAVRSLGDLSADATIASDSAITLG